MPATRALVAARVSRITASGQPDRVDRDDEEAQVWAEQTGRTVVHTTMDRGISGGVDPFKRPELGRWLTDSRKMATYDEIVASSVDRLGRNAADLFRLRQWAEDNDKKITVRSPALTWPPEPGDFASPIVWDVLARLAEMELGLIKKRYADVRRVISANGGLNGKPAFGFVSVGDRYSKQVVPDPELRPFIEGMITHALQGASYSEIARWLDSEGVVPPEMSRDERDRLGIAFGQQLAGMPLDHAWHTTSVRRVLSSPSLKGRRLDANGKVLMRHEGVTDAETWDRLQRNLAGRPHKRGPASGDTASLTGVVTCALCGGPMYRHRVRNLPRKDGTVLIGEYYRCKGLGAKPSKCRNMVRLDDLEAWVGEFFTPDGLFGQKRLTETVVVEGSSHTAELSEIEADLRALDFDDPGFLTQQAALLARRAELQAMPSEPARIEERDTGMTVADWWQELDDEGRRRYLLDCKVQVRVRPGKEPLDKRATLTGNPTSLTGLDYAALVRSARPRV